MNDHSTSQKHYWKIINRVMNKCRASKIPPLLVNNMFLLNCCEKQCTPIINSSVLPQGSSDRISGQMLLLCDNLVALPLKIIFQNILETSTFPDLWKLANVTPIFKKGDKQLIKNYIPISLLLICGKIFEKIIINNLYSYFNACYLITKNQSGFRPGDTNEINYYILLMKFMKRLRTLNLLKFVQYF